MPSKKHAVENFDPEKRLKLLEKMLIKTSLFFVKKKEKEFL